MPKGVPNIGTSVDLGPPPAGWMCHGCGESYPAKPQQCKKCGGMAFERVGGENHLREIAEAVASALEEDEVVIIEKPVKRGRRPGTFSPEDLRFKVNAARRHGLRSLSLSISQAEQVLGWK
jgi:predicted  nucleic acid-binding Zn-ribbon protein